MRKLFAPKVETSRMTNHVHDLRCSVNNDKNSKTEVDKATKNDKTKLKTAENITEDK